MKIRNINLYQNQLEELGFRFYQNQIAQREQFDNKKIKKLKVEEYKLMNLYSSLINKIGDENDDEYKRA